MMDGEELTMVILLLTRVDCVAAVTGTLVLVVAFKDDELETWSFLMNILTPVSELSADK